MVTAATRIQGVSDEMVDQYLKMTSTALNISGDQDNKMSTRDWSPVKA